MELPRTSPSKTDPASNDLGLSSPERKTVQSPEIPNIRLYVNRQGYTSFSEADTRIEIIDVQILPTSANFNSYCRLDKTGKT